MFIFALFNIDTIDPRTQRPAIRNKLVYYYSVSVYGHARSVWRWRVITPNRRPPPELLSSRRNLRPATKRRCGCDLPPYSCCCLRGDPAATRCRLTIMTGRKNQRRCYWHATEVQKITLIHERTRSQIAPPNSNREEQTNGGADEHYPVVRFRCFRQKTIKRLMKFGCPFFTAD